MDKKRLGFAALVAVFGVWLARETVGWLFGRVLDALAAGAGERVTWATFPWQNLIGVVLIGLGIYLALKSDHRAERNATLYERMNALFDRLDSCVSVSNPRLYPDIMGEATAVFESIEALGIPTPDLLELDVKKTYVAAHIFVGAIKPMVRDNHLSLARREAPKIIAGMGLPESHSRKLFHRAGRMLRSPLAGAQN